MKYKFRVSQTIYKQVEIEANDADEASDIFYRWSVTIR